MSPATESTHETQYRLAPMSPLIAVFTVILSLLPVLLLAAALGSRNGRPLLVAAVAAGLMYLWVWVRFRPASFVLGGSSVDVAWPAKRRQIPFHTISSVRLINRRELRDEIGWGMRVGAGGMWGGFGWLWTQKRGVVQMYISRLDRFVWIERSEDRPWLITPARPEQFVETLRQHVSRPAG